MFTDRNAIIYHAIKPGRDAGQHKYKKKELDITVKRLIKSYLCSGANSSCVVERECECLNACLYGQLYIRKTSEDRK